MKALAYNYKNVNCMCGICNLSKYRGTGSFFVSRI